MTKYNFENIRALLMNGFTDQELRRLCYDTPLFRPVYDQLARNTGKAEIIDLLIEYAEKKMLLDTLLKEIQERNPARFGAHQPYYDSISKEQTAQIQLILESEKASHYPMTTTNQPQSAQTDYPVISDSQATTPNIIRVDFLIVTALEEERDALLSKLPGYRKLPPSDEDVRVYYSANLPVTFADGAPGVYRLIVIPLLNMGRVQAAAATSDAIRRWRPRFVLLVGIAGGIAAKEVRLGDVLVSDQIVDYELQKLTAKGAQVRWEVHRADARLVGAARNFSPHEWLPLLATERPEHGMPKRHIGPIASGDKVIAFNKVLSKYRKAWPAIIGVEMEAAGVATAAFQAAQSPGFFMVRGVSDLADENKNTAGVQNWREYACDAAASYAIALLKSGPVLLSKQIRNEERKSNAPELPPIKVETPAAPLPSKLGLNLSWIFDLPRPRSILPDSAISARLNGYPPFRSPLAERELEYLFGEVGCFWSGHHTYATLADNFDPQIVVAGPGSGKTAFAFALTQVGSAEGVPLADTLPILISGENHTFKNVQSQITRALFHFINANAWVLSNLNQVKQQFLFRLLINGLGSDFVKLRLSQAIEADKSLANMIEQIKPTSRSSPHLWLPQIKQSLELLGFKQAILAIDLNGASALGLKFWLSNMLSWANHSLIIKLFLPEPPGPELGHFLDPVETLTLTWTDKQITDLVNWRCDSLSLLAGLPISLGSLFDEGLDAQFIVQAGGNPGRLARLWRYLFDHHLAYSPTQPTFTAENLARAVEQLS